ncbi:hypothetical protein RDV84_23295 [Lysobacter yananisis]|uniref:Uncharacterized protein n=1 Tax=Lysobacter yananisis TaxID=1003114 RepID=A0ABY9P715_9GAMM|nr:hypothetical protein [Lysobacter yananisis]WMT02853.1 hypothetical protein RDV84_23295 [Lysobacter yananisis]
MRDLRALIANDSHAATFQSLGQYRTALLREIDAAAPEGAQGAVEWQVRRTGLTRSATQDLWGWEPCTKELYEATLRTGRYAGFDNGQPCEVRALYTTPHQPTEAALAPSTISRNSEEVGRHGYQGQCNCGRNQGSASTGPHPEAVSTGGRVPEVLGGMAGGDRGSVQGVGNGNPLVSQEAARDRTPADYAIEHGGYLANSASRLLEARNDLDALVLRREQGEEVDDYDMHVAEECVAEASSDLRSTIYEFEKRRDRAIARPTKAAFVCTGDQIRCLDGNGCECELAGRKPVTDSARDREDAERYRWLRQNCGYSGSGPHNGAQVIVYYADAGDGRHGIAYTGPSDRIGTMALDSAIDAARGAGGGGSHA